MSYPSIHTEHNVGDIVYFHDFVTDTVQRGVVTGIQAQCVEPGYSAKWTVLYTVEHKFAQERPAQPSLIDGKDLRDTMRDAFPPLMPEVEAA